MRILLFFKNFPGWEFWEANMENESKELVIRIERELSEDERQEIQKVISSYPRQNGNVELGFF